MSEPANSMHPTALDSDTQQIGALYAKAILRAAGNDADEVVAELNQIVSACLDRFPALEAALASPRVKQDEKEAMLDRIFGGKISSTLLNFLKVLCRRQRIGSLRGIQIMTSLLRDEQLGRIHAIVTSALPLTDEQRSEIGARLKQSLGKDVVLREKTDASLIGGVVIRIGDKIYDGSVRGKLASIRSAVAGGIHTAMREQYESLLSS